MRHPERPVSPLIIVRKAYGLRVEDEGGKVIMSRCMSSSRVRLDTRICGMEKQNHCIMTQYSSATLKQRDSSKVRVSSVMIENSKR
jgi:hypothetical protein